MIVIGLKCFKMRAQRLAKWRTLEGFSDFFPKKTSRDTNLMKDDAFPSLLSTTDGKLGDFSVQCHFIWFGVVHVGAFSGSFSHWRVFSKCSLNEALVKSFQAKMLKKLHRSWSIVEKIAWKLNQGFEKWKLFQKARKLPREHIWIGI